VLVRGGGRLARPCRASAIKHRARGVLDSQVSPTVSKLFQVRCQEGRQVTRGRLRPCRSLDSTRRLLPAGAFVFFSC